MKQLIERFLENLSTRDVFLFRISCGNCGRECTSRTVRFSKAGMVPQSPQKKLLFDAVYEQEFQSARLSAIRDAAEHLNYCPICKRLVCNSCFLICDDLDMCRQCAAELNEHGNPVMPAIIDVAI